ncbi:hypothetical protein GCM10011369_21120 [Neiella marina]|uniref:HDOD domain-containing protein n=1 Tax=Neiella marina TaxID=508461 RepID=A0A8J2U5D3_9GAMM|nr:HD domain-containing phosphohydrolase [Neiella marina]GGA78927.1 hypothetical protein GCM10011369_21120 [Neiella marina]
MADVGKQISDLHQMAQELLIAVNMPEKADLPATAKRLSAKLCALAASDRPLTMSMLAIYSNQYQPAAQWIVKAGALTALLGLKLGFQESIWRRVVSAAVTMDLSVVDVLQTRVKGGSFSADLKSRWRKHPALSFSMLRKAGVTDGMWLSHVLQHHERPNGLGFPSRVSGNNLLPTSPLLTLVSDALELLMPTAKRQGLHPEQVIARLYWRRHHYHRCHLTALTELFQPVPVAAQLGLKRGGIALVVRQPVSNYLWAVKHYARQGQKGIEVIKLMEQDVARVYPMLKVDKMDLMALWLEGHRQMSNSLSKPWAEPTLQPSELKVKLSQLLNQENPNITKVSEYIASEPVLSEVLFKMANREIDNAKPTKAIKHAIMMIGLDRLGPMLLRSDLLSQCRQRRFPLDHWAYQYTDLFAECAAQIATQSYFMMPEQARTLATFAMVGWFSDTELNNRIQLKDRHQLEVELFSVFETLSATPHDELAAKGVEAARQWKIPLSLLQALEVFAGEYLPEEVPMKARHPYYLLILASHMMIQLLGKDSDWNERTALMTRLDISNKKFNEAREAVLACGSVICPLPQG